MSKRSSVPLKKASVLRITASIKKNKVYEDQSQGIVCYQDEHGEIICEGYDEGPCFQRISKPTYHPRDCARFRDAQITNLLLRQSWLQIVKGEELSDEVEVHYTAVVTANQTPPHNIKLGMTGNDGWRGPRIRK
ncbi:hypothetical protein SESBI_37171 [Sesbania bispinosa]|nr:hypothetical protein SESBI_37171 [Sesbania bispinosa]